MTSDNDKPPTGPHLGRLGDLDLLFASEEDFRKAESVFRESGVVLSAKDLLIKDCVASFLKLGLPPQRKGRRRTGGVR